MTSHRPRLTLDTERQRLRELLPFAPPCPLCGYPLHAVVTDYEPAYRCASNCLTVWWLDHEGTLQMSARVVAPQELRATTGEERRHAWER